MQAPERVCDEVGAKQAVIIDTQNKKAFIVPGNESADSTTTITH